MRALLRTAKLPTPSPSITLRFVFHLFVLPGSIRPRTCTSLTVLHTFGGSSSLSPEVFAVVVVVAFSGFFQQLFTSLSARLRDVREFYDLYWTNNARPQNPVDGGSLKSHQFATARDFLVV